MNEPFWKIELTKDVTLNLATIPESDMDALLQKFPGVKGIPIFITTDSQRTFPPPLDARFVPSIDEESFDA